MAWTEEEFERLLEASGVQYRCACGAVAPWQREAKLPPQWSLGWVTRHGRSYARYACPDCVANQHTKTPEASDLDAWRNRLASASKKGRKKKR